MENLRENQFEYSKFRNSLHEFEKKNAPDEFYFEGDISLLYSGVKISIVGSRKASPNGLKRAEILARTLVRRGITVVSGLAEGIDTIAHQTAIIHGGKTIAVLGTPLDKVYPKKNRELLEVIKKDHLAVSQFPIGFPTRRDNFPRRNRTMALISDATIIVEASEKSGTRHQGWEALNMGRDLFIMKNILDDDSILWAQEMLQYGAQVLTRENLEDSIDSILPSLSYDLDLIFENDIF